MIVHLKRIGWKYLVVNPSDMTPITRALTFLERRYKNVYRVKLCGKESFKVGLLDRVQHILSDRQFSIVNPVKSLPELSEKVTKELKLRDYQIDAANAVLKVGFGLVVSPTASGKTHIELALAKSFPKPVLVLVPSLGLITQFYTNFKKYFKKISVYGGGSKELSGDVVIMTDQSLVRQSPEVKNFLKNKVRSVISDEVHHCTAKAYSVLGKCSAEYRAGFSATPWAKDWDDYKKARLEANFGSPVYNGKEDSRVAPFVMAPKVYVVKFDNHKHRQQDDPTNKDLVFNAIFNRDYVEQKRIFLVNNKSRNKFIMTMAELLRKKGLNIYVAVSWVEHVNALQEASRGLSENTHFLVGVTPGEERDYVYSKIGKDAGVIIVGTVGGEGIDLRHLNVVILADGTSKSEIKTIQNIGRSTRLSEGKTCSIAVDINDSFFPQASKRRNKIYLDESFTILGEKDLLSFLE